MDRRHQRARILDRRGRLDGSTWQSARSRSRAQIEISGHAHAIRTKQGRAWRAWRARVCSAWCRPRTLDRKHQRARVVDRAWRARACAACGIRHAPWIAGISAPKSSIDVADSHGVTSTISATNHELFSRLGMTRPRAPSGASWSRSSTTRAPPRRSEESNERRPPCCMAEQTPAGTGPPSPVRRKGFGEEVLESSQQDQLAHDQTNQ